MAYRLCSLPGLRRSLGLLVPVLFIFLAAFLGTFLVDHTGRKKLLVVGFAGSAISFGLFAWLHDAAGRRRASLPPDA
jgi:MFS family permease